MQKIKWSTLISLLFLSFILSLSGAALASEQEMVESKLDDDLFNKLAIGQSEEALIALLGEPSRVDLSEYGFEWYIYNQDYLYYFQVGLSDGKVVALYTNSPYFRLDQGISFGTSKEEIEQRYGESLQEIRKGNTIFQYNSGNEYGLYLLDGVYVTIFYDIHNEYTVTAIQLIDEETELAFEQFYGEASDDLQASFERQAFDLANAVRARAGLELLEWNDQIAATARKHSQDMVIRNYFSHQNPDGKSPFDRMKADGLTYRLASENIAAGQTNAIFAHEGWMNSLGHRQNILGEFYQLGVGISFGGSYQIYYTQNFLQTP